MEVELTIAELCEAIEKGKLATVRETDEHFLVNKRVLNRFINEKKLHPLSRAVRSLS